MIRIGDKVIVILVFTEAVGVPASVNQFKKRKKRKKPIEPI